MTFASTTPRPGLATKPTSQSDFEALLKLSGVIVVPMLSSAWDIQAGEHFIAQLMTQRVWRARLQTDSRGQQSGEWQRDQPTTATFF